jgi:hypothetical protein
VSGVLFFESYCGPGPWVDLGRGPCVRRGP